MVLHPVGPLPPATYWRRRVVLVLGLLVLVLVARSCVGGDTHPRAQVSTRPTAAPTPARAPATTPKPTARPTATGVCPDSAVRVTVRTDAAEYAVGGSPRLTVTVTNTSTVPCRRDLGPGAVELLVYSGADRIWSSDDCSTDRGKELLTLKAGASLEKTVTWSGKRSAPGCPSPAARPDAKPGTYRVLARVGTVRSGAAVFRLHP